jgi:DNA-binding NtrC family response regulator
MQRHIIETSRLLVVSREPDVLRLVGSLAESSSWHLQTAATHWEAMEQIQSDSASHVLLLDVPRGDLDKLQLLSWLRRLCPDLAVIALCHSEDADMQTEAIRLGANDVLARPFDKDQLARLIERHLASPNSSVEPEMVSENIEPVGEDEFFISISPMMQNLRAQVGLLAQSDLPVLILGEPGSGKGTVARLIHELSVYSGFQFRRVNCADMPADLLEIELFGRARDVFSTSSGSTNRGKLEIGEKGTLLLDEITEMPLGLQTRLVQLLQDRALQEKRFVRSRGGKPVDAGVRILAASSHDLNRAVADKRLRDDLFYRLSAFSVQVPPLRQRKEEIEVLLRYSMHRLARCYGLPPRAFSASALAMCQSHSWPGNLTELQNFTKRYLVAGDEELTICGFNPDVACDRTGFQSSRKLALLAPEEVEADRAAASPKSLKSLIQSVKSETERNAIAGALEKTGWNRKAAARLLGVSYRAILYKIEQYRMHAPDSCVSSFPETRLAGADGTKRRGSKLRWG